ncbi:B12-binding domain-containing radical SAM protein [Lottiidibacillus patelloidae]|uniref:B12-binding domain-containing radical SAM protein n=1 Tax=Lottiidibacillus patelloidae TaxID=2670334 RepID=A0A263BWU4_9BACI|nr:B12-binding domain-containing radical SAM protein [Lottiidibacillus patelloidae]OZM58213.1 B12-binding domain-containing radical SAM protein [Lottiidibacillus patelloidae]
MKTVVSTLNAKYIHTNIALRYLKAYAEPEFEVDMAEYTIKDPAINIVSDLYSKKPDVLGFSCYIWNIEETIPVISMLKKINPNLKIILGGPEVTYDVVDWMKRIPEVDAIVIGEGEATFKKILQQFSTDGDLSEVPGIAYRRLDGEVKVNPQRDKIDLNTIPSPNRFPEDLDALSKRVVYLETSRGCPFSCQFCLSSIEVGVRYFNRERVKEDILFLMEHGAKTIKFVDRTFNISRSYAMEMFAFLIDNHREGTVFQFEITADIMRPEVLQYLNKNAPEGLFRFEIGVQSTNDDVNDLVQRKQNFNKLARTVTMVRDGGKIAQHLDLIAGLPEEDYNSFRKTFNDVFAFGPEELQLGFLKMLRGTGLRLRAKDHGYTYMDHSPYEILGNNVLSFDEIIRIKRVEDVLEKYWNDHRMDTTVLYTINNVFPSAFDFFQAFGDYWDKKGWARIGHQLEDLYTRLHEFLTNVETDKLPVIEAMMKYDYFLHHKYKPRKVWWDFSLSKDEQSRYLKAIADNPSLLGEEFAHMKISERDLHKHTMIEVLPFNIEEYKQSGEIVEQETLLLAFFDPKEQKTSTYCAPLSNI